MMRDKEKDQSRPKSFSKSSNSMLRTGSLEGEGEVAKGWNQVQRLRPRCDDAWPGRGRQFNSV
jgi:hypothetical protein